MLVAFSKSDREIGYVQGMNFVVASLTYHCREDVAFWLFNKLLGSYSMREIYQPNCRVYIGTLKCSRYLLNETRMHFGNGSGSSH